MKLAPEVVMPNARRPVESPRLEGDPIVPNKPGGRIYGLLKATSNFKLVTPSYLHVSKDNFSIQLMSIPTSNDMYAKTSGSATS
jgi:hypothetical protein